MVFRHVAMALKREVNAYSPGPDLPMSRGPDQTRSSGMRASRATGPGRIGSGAAMPCLAGRVQPNQARPAAQARRALACHKLNVLAYRGQGGGGRRSFRVNSGLYGRAVSGVSFNPFHSSIWSEI